MGQEVGHQHFHKHDFQQFQRNLHLETDYLHQLFETGRLSKKHGLVGFELEASLIDRQGQPAPENEVLIQACKHIEVSAELSRFNLEINSQPTRLQGDALNQVHQQLRDLWQRCSDAAKSLNLRLVMAGILPTITAEHLSVENMSALKRYRALNEQVMRMRHGKPLHIDIDGSHHLISDHGNVMIEAATTSFQMHWQVPPDKGHRHYNAMLIASAPLVALSANSPLLFGQQLWQESRIPLFEQSINVHNGTSGNKLPRVTFGTGYVKGSLLECFDENLQDYAVMLPDVHSNDTPAMQHLRLHNGTVWRWVRPITGFDADGTPHIRIEHRTTAAGPSVTDAVANAAFLFGLAHALAESDTPPEQLLPFALTRNNFYGCAKSGLQAAVSWLDGQLMPVDQLIQQQLLPMAREGLADLDVSNHESWLNIIEERVSSGRHGAAWQLAHFQRHSDLTAMTESYYRLQQSDKPVHTWDIS